jgi:uncharacterized protein
MTKKQKRFNNLIVQILFLVIFLGITGCSDERVDGDKKILQSLQGMKKPINIKDPEIIKMLCGSAGSGFIRSTEYLVDAGVDVNSKCGRANAPVLLHALGITGGSDENGTAIYLINHGADANKRFEFEYPLMTAVAYGRSSAVEALLKHHANPNAQNKRGETALMQIQDTDFSPHTLKSVSLLIEYGADVNIRAKNGLTVLKKAQKIGRTDIEKLLIASGARE